MYQVADDMIRLEFIGEMNLNHYTIDDIEYLKTLLQDPRGLISEGAELTLFTSAKYLIAAVASDFQKTCLMEPISVNIPKEVRMIFYSNAKKQLPQIINTYKRGDFERHVSLNLCILYRTIIHEKLGISC